MQCYKDVVKCCKCPNLQSWNNMENRFSPCLDCDERKIHISDCAMYNRPALPIGICDCGADVDLKRCHFQTMA